MAALGQYYDQQLGWVTIYERPEDIPDDAANRGGYFGVVYPSATLSKVGGKEVYETNSPLAISTLITLAVSALVVIAVSVSIVYVLKTLVTVIKAGQARVVDETADGSKIIRSDDGSLTLFRPDGSYENISGPTSSGTENLIWAGVAGVAVIGGLYATFKYVIPAFKSKKDERRIAEKALPKEKARDTGIKKYFKKESAAKTT